MNLDFRVFQDFLETKEKEVIRVRLVARAIEDLMVLLETMERPAFQAFQARWVPEVFLVPGDLVVCQDHLEFLEPKAAKEQRGMRVHLVHQDHLVKLEAKVPLDHPVQLVHLAHQDKLVQEENLVYLVYQDRMEFLEIQEILDNLGPKATPVPLAMLALLVFLDPEV